MALLSGLVFTLLFNLLPGLRVRDAARGRARFWTTFAWGLIPFFAYPVAMGALFLAGFIFGITVPIAISLSFGLGLVMFILTALALGWGVAIERLFDVRLGPGAGSDL